MATPGQKLATSLEALKSLQDAGIHAIKASDLSRVNRERLVANGFIKEVVKGWYISTPHNEQQGDTTSWYTSFWSFCAHYLNDRYGDDYCISAEQSLLLHAGNTIVPTQLIVRSTNGNNAPTSLLFGTSIFVMKSPLPNKAEIEIKDGLRMLNLPSALVYCTPSIYLKEPIEVRTALLMVKDASELLGILLDGGHSSIASRLIGAYRNLGQLKIAESIEKVMVSAGYDLRIVDPFESPSPARFNVQHHSPYINRLQLMWDKMRADVLEVFPTAPMQNDDVQTSLRIIEEIYVTDAYHSLSIEKYVVTPELIARVRSGEWSATKNEEDKRQKEAMAARGYWQSFTKVKASIVRILNGENSGVVTEQDHGEWYRELFSPSVVSGILKPSDLAGYRNSQVYIAQSKHTPFHKDAVRDAMPFLFEMLVEEPNAAVRAVLGHFFFGYIHPYSDGNGRIGRFLMNTMLISGGYPWTVVPVQQRDAYMKALEKASVEQNIKPLAQFLGYLVDASIKGNPIAEKMG